MVVFDTFVEFCSCFGRRFADLFSLPQLEVLPPVLYLQYFWFWLLLKGQLIKNLKHIYIMQLLQHFASQWKKLGDCDQIRSGSVILLTALSCGMLLNNIFLCNDEENIYFFSKQANSFGILPKHKKNIMYTPLYRMNQWHKKRYDKIHWTGIDVYLYGAGGRKKRNFLFKY